MRIARLMLAAAMLFAGSAWGQNFDTIGALNQQEFRLFSEDLGGALSYRPQTPTEPLGVLGFDIGVAITGAKIQHKDILEKATSDTVDATIPVPSLRAHIGLPFGFDIGAMYASVPSSNVKHYGGELRWAILKGDTITPAIGLRASVTKVTGVDELAFDTRGVDISISKGIAFITPYAGIGRVWVNSEPRVALPVSLQSEEFTLNKAFVGVGMKLLFLNFNFEADKTGDVSAYSAKIGVRF